jgi:acyl carrier protein
MPLKSKDEIHQWCVAYVARVLNQPVDRVGADTPFDNFGLDSAMSVEMIVELEQAMGVEISPTLLFEQTSIAKVASHLASKVAGS